MTHLMSQEMYLGREGQSPLELRRIKFSLDYLSILFTFLLWHVFFTFEAVALHR